MDCLESAELRHLRPRQGYATEAAAACRDHAATRLGAPELVAIVHPGNTASRRVAERIGMRHIDDDVASGQRRVILGMDLGSRA